MSIAVEHGKFLLTAIMLRKRILGMYVPKGKAQIAVCMSGGYF
jgi:hypothetical protein